MKVQASLGKGLQCGIGARPMKTFLLSLCVVSVAQAAAFDKASLAEKASAQAEQKEKAPVKADEKKPLIDSLKGRTETTRLPDTARYDARGGVFI